MRKRDLEKNSLTEAVVKTFDLALLKKKTVNAVFFLGIKRVIIQLLLSGAGIILARLLFPRIFGAYFIASGIVSLLGIFASLGLETALLQKKEEPTKEELQTVFTASLLLSLLVGSIIFILSPLLFSFYKEQLGEQGILYLQLLSLSIVFCNLKGVSSVLLERKLDYYRIVVAETLEMLVLQGTTIILAFSGFGTLSFIWGLLASRLASFVIFFILSPWPIGFRFSKKIIQKILPFGLNFQLNSIIGGLNGAVVPIFVGKVSGSSAVGLLNWAGGVAALSRAIPEIFGRLAFSVCSRTQDDKRVLRIVIEKSIQLSCLTTFPIITIMVVLAYPITYLIFTDKWLAGIPAFYCFSLQSVFVIISTILTQALLALGEAKTVRNISLFWAVLQWGLTVPLVFIFGFTGLAIAGALVSSTFFIPLIILKKKVKIEIGSHVFPYLAYSLLAGGVTLLLNNRFSVRSIYDLLVIATLGGAVYFALVVIFKRKEIIEDVLRIKRILNR